MNNSIDVLAVMDDAADVLSYEGGAFTAYKLEQARAAVAELILALELSDAWIREASHQGMPRATATLDRNRTALARVKGAQP